MYLVWTWHWSELSIEICLNRTLENKNYFALYVLLSVFLISLSAVFSRKLHNNVHIISKIVDRAMSWNKISGRADLFLSTALHYFPAYRNIWALDGLALQGELHKDEKRIFAMILALSELIGRDRTGWGDSCWVAVVEEACPNTKHLPGPALPRHVSFILGKEDRLSLSNPMNILPTVLTKVWCHSRAVTKPIQPIMTAEEYANSKMPSMVMKRNPRQKKFRKFKSTSGSLVSVLFFPAIHLLTMKCCGTPAHLLYLLQLYKTRLIQWKKKNHNPKPTNQKSKTTK